MIVRSTNNLTFLNPLLHALIDCCVQIVQEKIFYSKQKNTTYLLTFLDAEMLEQVLRL